MTIKDKKMTDNNEIQLLTPMDVMKNIANKARQLRLALNMPQVELARRVGVAVGTVKRFENTGAIQFKHLLQIALVLGRLDDFESVLRQDVLPKSLFGLKEPQKRQRARSK